MSRAPYEQRIKGDGSNWCEIMIDAFDDLMATAYEACTEDEVMQLHAYISNEVVGECKNVGEPTDFCCSECGARLYTEMGDGYTMIECDEKTIIKTPKHCPNCGKAVKR